MSLTNKLPVLYEDSDLLVINKPAGIVANISQTSPENTVQNYLKDKFDFDEDSDSEFVQRSGLVHRLDKDTSGVIMAAKNEETFKYLKSQFIKRKVRKEYIALSWGEITNQKFHVNAPIKRDPRNRMKMAIVPDGRPAFTEGEIIKKVNIEEFSFTLVRIFPKTGRTHQIRVHLAALSHPVVGDQIYMTKKQLKSCDDFYNRLMLHAWKLSFYHEKLDKELKIEAPLPPEFDKIYSKP